MCCVETAGLAIMDLIHVHEVTGSEINDKLHDGLEGMGLEVRNQHDAPIAVWSCTGVGNGRYPVYADTFDTPVFGKQVARIVVDCMGVEPESDDVRRYFTDTVFPLVRRCGEAAG
jgi:hypothetical protein